MTDPVTHMCWSEQISPLAYSSQAPWQAFNLSQLHRNAQYTPAEPRRTTWSDVFHTSGSNFSTAQSAFDCQQRMAAIARVTYVTSHSLQPSRKTEIAVMHSIFLGTNTVHRSIRPSIRIRFCISIMSKMSKSELFGIQFANLSPSSSCIFGETWPRMRDISASCQAATWFGRFQHRIHRVLPYARVIWQFCCIIIKI